jgi:hypothetical protein
VQVSAPSQAVVHVVARPLAPASWDRWSSPWSQAARRRRRGGSICRKKNRESLRNGVILGFQADPAGLSYLLLFCLKVELVKRLEREISPGISTNSNSVLRRSKLNRFGFVSTASLRFFETEVWYAVGIPRQQKTGNLGTV